MVRAAQQAHHGRTPPTTTRVSRAAQVGAARAARKDNEDKQTGFVQPASEFVQQGENGVTQAIENIGAPYRSRTGLFRLKIWRWLNDFNANSTFSRFVPLTENQRVSEPFGTTLDPHA
jgi:hypothetical protein